MPSPLFFYGTLRHVPLLEVVLGRPLGADALLPKVLDGYVAMTTAEGPFPMLVAQEGGSAQGMLLQGLSAEDVARLDFYEGGFDYDLVDVVLRCGTPARVYLSAPEAWTPQGAWDIDVWAAQWAAMSCFAAQEVMTHYGSRSRQEVAEMFPQIRARAWSRVLGSAGAPTGQGVHHAQIEIIDRHRAYTGFFAVDEVRLRHARFDGRLSQVLERAYFIGGDAALVLPYDPVRDRVLLVEQMRMGPLGRGDPEVWHLEPVAGRIDPGETPQQAARREAQEEAGLVIDTLEPVSQGYASPGDATTYFHVFVGLADLRDRAAGLGGLASEHEDIRARLVSFDDFIAMAETRALANTPLTLLAYWLAHHRSRLRS